ncbi:protein flx-like 2 [Phtheirospermum japonicum]|uniref:Protein flx-like 2 n=1 Tax=Phtheirospermum japonicum TaxID=374723 RepID=A0A830BY11_9LAMI|nr:protein flx-like 2 [Phtheirospermum japonicum]
MASKGRAPPPHLRHPLSGPGVAHPDQYASAIRPPLGGFPPFEMMHHPEVMAQKLSAQHVEIEKLVTENRRLAATHGTLRQDLATAKHDLQLVHAHIVDVKAEKEQQMRGMVEKMSTMESEVQGAETVKTELQKARAEAHNLLATRQELISKAQQLSRDLQMAHSDAQQIPVTMAELDRLTREATYEYEKKLYSDHLESLQVMETNYMKMSREVEKLRAELTNSTSFDPRTGVPYGGSAGYNEGVPVGNYSSGQNPYGIGQQGQASHPGGSVPASNSPHVLAQSAAYGPGTAPRGLVYGVPRPTTGYDPHRGPAGAGYDAQRAVHTGPNYDAQRGPTGPGYDAQKGPAYNGQHAPPYDSQRVLGDDVQRGTNFDAQKGATGYDASTRGAVGPQGPVPMNNAPYGSTPSARGGNPVRRSRVIRIESQK